MRIKWIEKGIVSKVPYYTIGMSPSKNVPFDPYISFYNFCGGKLCIFLYLFLETEQFRELDETYINK